MTTSLLTLRRRMLSFFLLSMLTLGVSFAQKPAFIEQNLEEYIKKGMQDWHIPGLSIAIVKDGKVLMTKGFGTTSTDGKQPVDENTLFMIASNTKLFVGTLAAKLEQEKKLSLNDKVQKWLPSFALYDAHAQAMVTLRDLLCHRLGTKTFQGDFLFWNSNISREEVVKKMAQLVPSQEFRQDYGYCNAAFVAAGEVMKACTGRNWEDLVLEHFLTPLEMNRTWPLGGNMPMKENAAKPYTWAMGKLHALPFDNVDNIGAAGSMISCAKDLANWLIFQLDSGKFKGKQLLPFSVLEATRKGNILVRSSKSAVFPMHYSAYGLGLFSADYAGKQVFWHTGGAFGYVSSTCFVPELKLGIAILSNQDNQNFFEALRYQILDAYLGVEGGNRSEFYLKRLAPDQEEQDALYAALLEKADKGEKFPMSIDSYCGTYEHPFYGTLEIKKDNAKTLAVSFMQHPALKASLFHTQNNTVVLKYDNIGYGIFETSFELKEGKVVALSLQVNPSLESGQFRFEKKK